MKEKVEFVKNLIGLANENNLTELSVDFKGIRVDIRKGVPHIPVPPYYMNPAPYQAMAQAVDSRPSSAEEKTEEEIPSNLIPVKSPLAGVFYRAPKPGAPPFANVGDVVEKDQVLCIIEAMKIMNEITSEHRGKVARIVMENSDIANDGDVIMYLEPIE